MLPDGNLLRNIRLRYKLRSIILPPAVIEQLLHEPNGIDLFKGIDFLVSSGAPMNPAVGNPLSKVVEIVSPFGSTETFLIPELASAIEEWEWHEFNPHFKHEMRLYDPNEGTFELIVFADDSNKDTTAIYHNLPGVVEYRTKDLFTQHPRKPRLFKYYGRSDDIIVLANGEKLNPIPLEISIQSHPSLKGAFVIGNEKTQAALIVEPKDALDVVGRTKLLSELWPLVEKSNSLISGQGRIQQGKVLCAVPEKPLSRTAKGTIIRKVSEAAYKDEIEQLYSDIPSQERGDVEIKLKPTIKSVYELPMVVDFLRDIFAISFAAGGTVGVDEDFFAHGLDSLQTLEIVSNLKRNLRGQTSSSTAWITPRTIFHNPTLDSLARVLVAFLNDGAKPEEDSDRAQARIVNDTVERYTRSLPKGVASQTTEPPKTFTVALLGSTGFLGSYIVASLLKDPKIGRIYCLNRASDAQKRQEAFLHSLDMSLQPFLTKLEYMKVELGKPFLGLAKDEHEILAGEADVVVYNAWRLDFGHSVRSFDPFLRAASDVVGLSLAGGRDAHVVFCSSLSAVGNLAKETAAPEAPVEDPSAALGIGYARSKLAAERILTAAAKRSGVRVSVIRIGQVGGPQDGNGSVRWADQPWISALLRTAKTLGCVPDHVTRLDWVPVDIVAAMMHDFILLAPTARGGVRVGGGGGGSVNSSSSGSSGGRDAEFFHIYPPRPQAWGLLLGVLRDEYGIAGGPVPLREWVSKLRRSVVAAADPTAAEVARMPALKLLDYYEALGDGMETSSCSTARAAGASGVQIPTVGREMLRSWLGGWDL